VVRLGEDPGHRDEAGASEVRPRMLRGSGSGAGPGAPGEGPRVIDLQRARQRGRAGSSPAAPERAAADDEGPLEPDWKDILALIIATFEVLGPFLLMLFGAAGLVYLFLKLIAH
jgi:hypothetical protein